MSKAIASPLQALLAQAAAAPRETGESAHYKTRHRASGSHVILCDTSSSMADQAGSRTRIAHLRDALRQVARPEHVLIAFSSAAQLMRTVDDLPQPSGGTCLEAGLDAAARHDPAVTLVISDGEPNVPSAALDAAARMPGRIDVIYCGDERNAAAIEFMRQLARAGAGRVVVHRWDRQDSMPIAQTMRVLLAGPKAG